MDLPWWPVFLDRLKRFNGDVVKAARGMEQRAEISKTLKSNQFIRDKVNAQVAEIREAVVRSIIDRAENKPMNLAKYCWHNGLQPTDLNRWVKAWPELEARLQAVENQQEAIRQRRAEAKAPKVWVQPNGPREATVKALDVLKERQAHARTYEGPDAVALVERWHSPTNLHAAIVHRPNCMAVPEPGERKGRFHLVETVPLSEIAPFKERVRPLEVDLKCPRCWVLGMIVERLWETSAEPSKAFLVVKERSEPLQIIGIFYDLGQAKSALQKLSETPSKWEGDQMVLSDDGMRLSSLWESYSITEWVTGSIELPGRSIATR